MSRNEGMMMMVNWRKLKCFLIRIVFCGWWLKVDWEDSSRTWKFGCSFTIRIVVVIDFSNCLGYCIIRVYSRVYVYKFLTGRILSWDRRNDLSALIFPTIFLDHMGQFNDELALLVLLAGFIGLLIFPSENCFATITVYVSHCMKSSE